MKALFHKQYCSHCGKAYDPARGRCPYCGEPGAYPEEAKSFRNFAPLGTAKEPALFLTGWLGFNVMGVILSLLVLSLVKSAYQSAGFSGNALTSYLQAFESSTPYLAIINYSAYILIFCVMIAIVGKDLPRLLESFKNVKVLYGFLYGLLALVASFVWNIISQALGATGSSSNQNSVVSMIGESPFLAILCIGLIGPFTEELTYRVGLFGFAKRINVYVAYFAASVVFGFIHMHFIQIGNNGLVWVNSVNDWLSLPDYMIAGFIFAWAYDHHGIGGSFIAHATNNLVAVIEVLIALSSGQIKA